MFEKIDGQYRLVEIQTLPQMNGTGYVFYHRKTKARVVVISNDDDNKVFNIGFRTPPKDDTGVPHIMEHSVLCGSEKFPIKDPFVELVKGSLNTFLNAMTYPDKTVYPVASCNDKDFQNLMDVYLDAVFHPNIYKRKEIMMQEGWHYECEDASQPIQYNGVVYNEMKGVFSSPEQQLDRLNMKTLYPDTPYFYESGGDPEYITDLTYEDFIAFHQKYYHPSNSYIYLYGNMDIEEKLAFIDKEYLSHYDYLQVDSKIEKQKPFEQRKEVEEFYAISSEEEEKDKTYLSYNVVVGRSTDPELYLATQILEYVLVNVPGAPLKKALIDAGIGNDIISTYESSLIQPMFSIIAQNANPEDKERFVQVIQDTLQKIVEDGIDRKSLKAAINVYEFQNREANFGSYPKGLMYGLKMFDSWLYEDSCALTHLMVEETFEFLKEQLETDYYEQLVQKYFLDNTHATIVALRPQKGLAAQKEEKLAKKLADYKATLDSQQIEDIVATTKALKEYQDSEDSKEDLEKIPLLTIADIEKKTKPFINEEMSIEGIKTVLHNTFTNGITYLSLCFDMRSLPLNLVPYASLLVSMLKQVDTKNYSYRELASEINLYTGGMSSSTSIYKNENLKGGFGAVFQMKAKVLHNNVAKAVELMKEILFTSNLADEKRLKEIIAEQKVGMRSEITNAGHLAMANRAMSYFDQGAKYKEMMESIDYYETLVDWCEHFEDKKVEIVKNLQETAKLLFTSNHLTVSVTTEEQVEALLSKPLNDLKTALYEDVQLPVPEVPLQFVKEGFKTSSQVQYVSCAGDYKKAGYDYTGALLVLKMIFSYEYLWMNIRVKGGAYGCACTFGRFGNGFFTSYRDPNLKETYKVYENAAAFVEQFDVDERTMTKYIIGAISGLDTPLTPSAYGAHSFAAYLSGISEADKQKERDEVLSANVESIRALAPIVKAVFDEKAFAALGNEGKVLEQEDLFDKTIVLP